MEKLKMYDASDEYITYLHQYDHMVALPKVACRKHTRKYIGIVLRVNGFNYFINLSSFKEKHLKMKESVDFLKIKDCCVLNINNMVPIPDCALHSIDFASVPDKKYRALLHREYREIKARSKEIIKNAKIVYNHKIRNGTSTALAARCCDFKLLEDACERFENVALAKV